MKKRTKQDTMTAETVYKDNADRIEALMHTLKNELLQHKDKAAAEPDSWLYAADLAIVRDFLEKAVIFMTRAEEKIQDPTARQIEGLIHRLKNELFRYIYEFTPNTRSSTQPKDLSPVKSLLEEAVSHMHQANEQ